MAVNGLENPGGGPFMSAQQAYLYFMQMMANNGQGQGASNPTTNTPPVTPPPFSNPTNDPAKGGGTYEKGWFQGQRNFTSGDLQGSHGDFNQNIDAGHGLPPGAETVNRGMAQNTNQVSDGGGTIPIHGGGGWEPIAAPAAPAAPPVNPLAPVVDPTKKLEKPTKNSNWLLYTKWGGASNLKTAPTGVGAVADPRGTGTGTGV